MTEEQVSSAPGPAGRDTVTLVLSAAEAKLVHSALGSYLSIFGHDERDSRAAIRSALAKLDAAERASSAERASAAEQASSAEQASA